MGCDIHVHLEWKRRNDEKWNSGDLYSKNYDGKYYLREFYNARDYDLFALLANVRNRNEIDFISMPRGLPNDATPETVKDAEDWRGDGHSHSWLTLKEIIDYDAKHKPIKRSGYMTREDAQRVEDGDEPNSYCRDYFPKDGHLVWKEWERADDTLKSFYEPMIDQVQKFTYMPESEYDNVRAVFWFDN